MWYHWKVISHWNNIGLYCSCMVTCNSYYWGLTVEICTCKWYVKAFIISNVILHLQVLPVENSWKSDKIKSLIWNWKILVRKGHVPYRTLAVKMMPNQAGCHGNLDAVCDFYYWIFYYHSMQESKAWAWAFGSSENMFTKLA